MLLKIWSDKFLDDGEERDPIVFHKGLNTIRGGQKAENSIGKSTLLSVIGFAFGGNEFLKSKAVKAVHHHTIWFTFKFGEDEHTYSRSTNEFDFVQAYEDSKGTIPTEKMSVDEFRQELKSYYGMKSVDASLDEILSRFFRIQELSVGMVTQPLKADLNEPVSVGVAILEKLFGKYKEILALEQPYRKASDELKALNAVRAHELLPAMSIKSAKEYKARVNELEKLRKRLSQLNGESDQQLLDLHERQDAEVIKIFAVLKDLKSRARSLSSKISHIDNQLNKEFTTNPQQLQRLQRFFPDVNIRTITEVEKFHETLVVILQEELSEQMAQYSSELNDIRNEIGHFESELRRKQTPVELPTERFQEIAEVTQQVTLLNQAVKAWEKSEKVQEEKKVAKQNLQDKRPPLLEQITSKINSKLAKYDESFHGEEHIPPILRFNDKKKYTYGSPVDDGTGSSDKNLILFDLSILALTKLPVVAHDSPLIKNIADETVEKILELYLSFKDKQIFIVFDKDSSYSKRTQEIVNETEVIQLGENEHALYGWAWYKDKSLLEESKEDVPDDNPDEDVAEGPDSLKDEKTNQMLPGMEEL